MSKEDIIKQLKEINMTSKVLRSLIHEIFPFDLRVELELLSRRRDINNKGKQEEIFHLLRKYNIDNTTKLGSGTNRYGFKIEGFVLKVATDKLGKIDNLSEFKNAKKLFPYVIKVYECSKNGTLLICEYIQPFESFSEMIIYEDQIRSILKKLSSVYLIGDVGISNANYGNWGLRVGTHTPVCLDFAYIYEVKSSLFLCEKCKQPSILIPNNNYSDLVCRRCKREFSFASIREKIGNENYLKQIGNIAEEGYELYDSFVLTELTYYKSNYLSKKQEEVQEKPKKEEIIKPFILPRPPSSYL
jgi:hypothetical protein